jgi:light-regulated signal transduction histidine kinase (bacteriophytochrome)
VPGRLLKFLIVPSLAEEAPRIAELLREGGYDTEWILQADGRAHGLGDKLGDQEIDSPTGALASWDLLFPDFREQLRAMNEELREKIRLLERSNADLEQFAWAASHDLKEPLRTISGYTQLLLRRRMKEREWGGGADGGPYRNPGEHNLQNETDAAEFARYIQQGVERMGAMLDALLAYSRAMYQPLGPDHVADAQGAAQDAIETLAAAMEETGAKIGVDPLPPVFADAAPLTQIFQNLLANALKYRRPEAAPAVHISATTRGDEVRFAVSDNGLGIAAEHYHRIFDVFRRLHGEEYEGLGIGLAICKRLVERYGGRIWLDSEVGTGSTFYFTLRSTEKARVIGRP